MSVISLNKVEKIYGDGPAATVALKDITLEVKTGEFVVIMGPSGSGKSTLMNIIGLLDSPTSGTYTFEDTNVSKHRDAQLARIRRQKIGFIFQNYNLLQRHTALENVTLPMIYAHIERFRRQKTAANLLQRVGLEERLYHLPNELSGGQMQRVAIARALANSPSLILADEPTGNLDTKTGAKVMKLLTELHEEGHTILMVTHDEKVASYAKRSIHMVDGTIDRDSDNLPESNLEKKANRKETKNSRQKSKNKTSKKKTASTQKKTSTKKKAASKKGVKS